MNGIKAFLNQISIAFLCKKIPKKGDAMTKEELQAHLDAICRNNGFDYAKYLGKYHGDDIYKPSFYEGNVLYGRPVFLHVRGGKVRRSMNYKEASEVLNFFYKD